MKTREIEKNSNENVCTECAYVRRQRLTLCDVKFYVHDVRARETEAATHARIYQKMKIDCWLRRVRVQSEKLKEGVFHVLSTVSRCAPFHFQLPFGVCVFFFSAIISLRSHSPICACAISCATVSPIVCWKYSRGLIITFHFCVWIHAVSVCACVAKKKTHTTHQRKWKSIRRRKHVYVAFFPLTVLRLLLMAFAYIADHFGLTFLLFVHLSFGRHWHFSNKNCSYSQIHTQNRQKRNDRKIIHTIRGGLRCSHGNIRVRFKSCSC